MYNKWLSTAVYEKQHTVSVNAGLLSTSIIDILNNKTKVPQIVG